jgi:hypothetical protein
MQQTPIRSEVSSPGYRHKSPISSELGCSFGNKVRQMLRAGFTCNSTTWCPCAMCASKLEKRCWHQSAVLPYSLKLLVLISSRTRNLHTTRGGGGLYRKRCPPTWGTLQGQLLFCHGKMWISASFCFWFTLHRILEHSFGRPVCWSWTRNFQITFVRPSGQWMTQYRDSLADCRPRRANVQIAFIAEVLRWFTPVVFTYSITRVIELCDVKTTYL